MRLVLSAHEVSGMGASPTLHKKTDQAGSQSTSQRGGGPGFIMRCRHLKTHVRVLGTICKQVSTPRRVGTNLHRGGAETSGAEALEKLLSLSLGSREEGKGCGEGLWVE
jgi:hypothetical protein